MSTKPATRRVLRSRDDIFAAGYEAGAALAPLTDDQVRQMAALFAPTLNAPRHPERGAA